MANPIDVWFNSNNLNSITGVQVLNRNTYILPERKLATFPIARTDQSSISSAFYQKKEIVFSGRISRASRALMEAAIDSLKGILQEREANLDFYQSGALRRHVATVSAMSFQEVAGGFARFSVSFLCSNPIGKDIGATVLISGFGVTTSPKSYSIDFGGTAPFQQPIIRITYQSVTNGTDGTVTVENDSTNQTLSVNRDWVNGDVLEIDVENKTVKINGAEANFSGAIPEWAIGSGAIIIADDFTARSFDINLKYNKRYV